MLSSVYATDTPDIRGAVLEQATDAGSALFTSLHMPETTDLADWLAWMGRAHAVHGATFWADISPATFDHLGHGPDDVDRLTRCGIVGLRLDFGYGPLEMARIATASGLPIAVNASTITADELDATLAALGPTRGPALVGWHNFYPRPGTGLAAEDLVAQSRLFTERGLEVVAFVAGDTGHRAPLHRGLPTLESHRHRNTYACALDLDRLVPGIAVACAEGTVLPRHLRWTGDALPASSTTPAILTLPIVDVADGCQWLFDEWELRRERSTTSRRLLGTRGRPLPHGAVPADVMEAGSVQMDTLGRYAGEVSLFTADAPLDGEHLRLADIASPYRSLVAHLDRFERIRFVPVC